MSIRTACMGIALVVFAVAMPGARASHAPSLERAVEHLRIARAALEVPEPGAPPPSDPALAATQRALRTIDLAAGRRFALAHLRAARLDLEAIASSGSFDAPVAAKALESTVVAIDELERDALPTIKKVRPIDEGNPFAELPPKKPSLDPTNPFSAAPEPEGAVEDEAPF